MVSPILFTVYIDELLQRLQKLGVGCHWEGMFVGGLCYADDLALIAPSAHALRRMLQVCSDFASEKNLIMQGKLNSFASVHINLWLWMNGLSFVTLMMLWMGD